MKHISILVPLGHTSLPNIDGTLQIFTEVNRLQVRAGEAPLFEVQLVGLQELIPQRNGMYTTAPDVLIKDIKRTDLVIIPACHGDIGEALHANQDFVPWIKNQYLNGAEIASFCVGAFLLAATGLVDGKQCATHWVAASQFRQIFPAVHLVNDKIMTAQDGIYTSGGAYSFLNLIIYLVEKYAGRETAIYISKAFMIDIDRVSQSPFMIFEGQKTHDDAPIKQAQEIIEQNFTEKITVNELAGRVALGRRNLERRFKKATCNTIAEYMQRVKVEAAKKSFESSRKNINEVMYEVGYSDNKAFRSVFKKITGMSPVDYRNKYRRHREVA